MAVVEELLREKIEDLAPVDYGDVRIQVVKDCMAKSNARMNAYGHVYSNHPTREELVKLYTDNAAAITSNFKTDPVPEVLEMLESNVSYARTLPKGDSLYGIRFEPDRPEQAVTLEALMDQEEERFWSLHNTMLKLLKQKYNH